MVNKYIFIDRDGVINEEKHLLSNISEIKLIKNSAKAIRALNDNDLGVIVISNQPVVARGLCSIKDVEEMNVYISTLIREESGGSIDAFYYCAHHPTEGKDSLYTRDCKCRKPKPGMILEAKSDFKIKDLSQCFMVGDKISDIKAGNDAGCRTILVSTGYGGKGKWHDSTPDYYADDLHAAVSEVILQK